MGRKRSDRKPGDVSPDSHGSAPARPRHTEAASGSCGTDNPRIYGAPTPPPSMQPGGSPAALYLLLDEVHHLIDFGEALIAEYKANSQLNAPDRFAKLEAWLLALTEKVFPGLVKPGPEANLGPVTPIGFRAGPWIPASRDRIERPAVDGALRSLAEQTRAWKALFPFRPQHRPPLGRGPRLVELPDDSVDEAELKRYEEELGQWNDTLKSTDNLIIKYVNDIMIPFKSLRAKIVDQLLQEDEQAHAEVARNRPGYLGLILGHERHWVRRSGWGVTKVDLAGRRVLWGLLVRLVKSGEGYCSLKVLEDAWEDFGGAEGPEPGTIYDSISELKHELDRSLGITIKNARNLGWRLESLED
jgi:hypothetical protein